MPFLDIESSKITYCAFFAPFYYYKYYSVINVNKTVKSQIPQLKHCRLAFRLKSIYVSFIW
jgi:hypothetical protein